jgi:ubiquinone/menaquinone biosynthesis C-methylase UbiE
VNGRFYRNDRERWSEINKVRETAAKNLAIPTGSHVLDVLAGPADFSIMIAKAYDDVEVTAVEITGGDIQEARQRIETEGLRNKISLVRMDVTNMKFSSNAFDYVVNFVGWEDLAAISGEELVITAFDEMVRVLKPSGVLAVTFIPTLEAEDDVANTDNQLRGYMYRSVKGPKYFPEEFFLQMFQRQNIRPVNKTIFRTSRSRLSPEDAKGYISWICENYKSFYAPDVEMRHMTRFENSRVSLTSMA